jgi:eukaryotic-like serine/threonine-protein kinase
VAEKHRADQQAAMAQAVNDFLANDLLAAAGPEQNPQDRNVTVLELMQRAAKKVADKFASQPEAEAAIRTTIGDTYRAMGYLEESQPHLERGLEFRRKALGPEHPHTVSAMNGLATLHWARGRYDEAESLFQLSADD